MYASFRGGGEYGFLFWVGWNFGGVLGGGMPLGYWGARVGRPCIGGMGINLGVRQVVIYLVCTMFITNNHDSFHLW